MINIRRYYNQNRKKIWGVIIIVVSAFVLIQLLNSVLQANQDRTQNIISNNEETKIDTENSKITANTSAITGEKISNENLENATKIIDDFINYCNKKDLEKAYSLLTDKCKEEMYSSIEIFENSYYNDVFNGESKNCNIENWLENTYRVKIMSDSLSTGKSNDGYAKEDYITVEKEDEEYKININSYIGNKEINTTTEKNNIKVEVISKDTYKDYENYTLKVTNNTQSLVELGDINNSDSICLEDSKGVKYPFYNHESTKPMLTVKSGQTKEVTIKFYSGYVSNRKIKNVVFSKLSLYDGELSEEIEFKANI